MNLQWHVVRVASRTEKKVQERLKSQGVEAYVAIQKQLRQWSDRKKWVDMVILSSYVFVNIESDQQLLVLQTPGVVSFLKYMEKPVIIKTDEMLTFMNFITKAKQPIVFVEEKDFEVGSEIKIVSGKFEGYSGKVMGKRSNSRVYVFLEHFGYFLVSDQDVEELKTNKPNK